MDTNSQHPTRRDTLKAGMAAIIAAGVAPMVFADDKAAADKALVVGSGNFTYEVVDGWAKLPENKRFGNTHSVIELADNTIGIHHTGAEAVSFFDPDGKFINSWGAQFKGNAHGMDLRKEGNEEFLYFSTTGMRQVIKTNLKGDVVFTLDYPKDAVDHTGKPCYADEKKYSPTFIAFAPNGDFYVTDGYGSAFIHQYTIDGKYIRTWGGRGKDQGFFNCPHGIFLDNRDAANPLLVVADRANVRLQWFTLDGKFVKLMDKDLRHPCAFSIHNGHLLVPDLKGRITILNEKNELALHLGDNPNEKQRGANGVKKEDLHPGVFCTPHGAIWDRAGNIYVTEWLPYGRVTKLRKV